MFKVGDYVYDPGDSSIAWHGQPLNYGVISNTYTNRIEISWCSIEPDHWLFKTFREYITTEVYKRIQLITDKDILEKVQAKIMALKMRE